MPSKGTLYLLDDVALVRKVLRLHLEKLNYHVEEFTSAQAVLTATQLHRPQAVFVNCKTQEFDAFAFIAQLRALLPPEKVKIVMIFSERDVGAMAKGLHLGATDYLLKPFDLAHLLEITNRF
jgi:DNA-binding response OmpR family regulator